MSGNVAWAPQNFTVRTSSPEFQYQCTCGKCWGHMVPMSDEMKVNRLKEFKEVGFNIIDDANIAQLNG